jgi:3-hydroxybutyrate dehydrogenase
MSQLDGKLAIVTGSASGIGRQIALRFAREGAKIAVADLDLGRAQEVVSEITLGGGIATAVAMDVADEAQVEAGVDEVAARLGGVDILVSNAGIQHIAPLVDLLLADWRKILAVHLDGAFLTTRACLRHMIREGRGGTVLYIGSVHSVEASPLKAPYVTAKHGLIGLARLVAKEGAVHGVRANVICPGFVRTPLVDRQIPEQARELGLTEDEVVKKVMLRETVDGEFTTAEDIAEVAVFFAAFPSLALTGQSLVVSHGWHMQ